MFWPHVYTHICSTRNTYIYIYSALVEEGLTEGFHTTPPTPTTSTNNDDVSIQGKNKCIEWEG